jgi:hypothetical protein
MRLGTNHFHRNGGRAGILVSAKLNNFSLPVQELEYFFSNFTFQYNGNSVETFFSLAIVRAKKKFQHYQKKTSPPFSVRKWLELFMILI